MRDYRQTRVWAAMSSDCKFFLSHYFLTIYRCPQRAGTEFRAAADLLHRNIFRPSPALSSGYAAWPSRYRSTRRRARIGPTNLLVHTSPMTVFAQLRPRMLLAALLALGVFAPPAPARGSAASPAAESAAHKAERMQWFADAKLGIFIHWGIYAVNGIDESWSFFNGKISHADYMKQ